MEIIKGIENLQKPFRNPVVTLGNFDGIHLGHQRIFEKLKEEARKFAGESVVVTFEPHPLKILAPGQCPPLLTPFKKKMMLMEKVGIASTSHVQGRSYFAAVRRRQVQPGARYRAGEAFAVGTGQGVNHGACH